MAVGAIDAPAEGKAASRSRPPRRPAQRLELGLGVGEPSEDDVGVADEHLAGLGEPHAARGALDEGGAGLALQGGDLLGDG